MGNRSHLTSDSNCFGAPGGITRALIRLFSKNGTPDGIRFHVPIRKNASLGAIEIKILPRGTHMSRQKQVCINDIPQQDS